MNAAQQRIQALAAHFAAATPVSPPITLPRSEPMRVLVTGAAGQIAYSLVNLISTGAMLGPKQKIILHLFDIPAMKEKLNGVLMELQDGAYEVLDDVIVTIDEKEAFSNIDIALLVGAMPRLKGMERKDLLQKNAEIFRTQGKALDKYAKKNVKVLVVGNPANTNALIALKNAPSIPPENFTALTRLDHNRALTQIALKVGVKVEHVHNVAIWGNHSATQFPDVDIGYVEDAKHQKRPIRQVVNDNEWLLKTFVPTVQQRGAAVLAARQASSAASAAKAIVDHMRDWLLGTSPGKIVSMGVYIPPGASKQFYTQPGDLIFSFPVTCSKGHWHVVEGIAISETTAKFLDITAKELLEEKAAAGIH